MGQVRTPLFEATPSRGEKNWASKCSKDEAAPASLDGLSSIDLECKCY